MSIRYHVKFLQIGLVFLVLSGSTWAGDDVYPPPRKSPKGAKFYTPLLNEAGEDKLPWEYNMDGDQDLLSCTLEDKAINENILVEKGIELLKKKLKIPKIDGICEAMNYTSILDKILSLINGGDFDASSLITEFIGSKNIGSSFDLGGFAQCKLNLPELKDTALAKFCKEGKPEDFSISPLAAMSSLSIDGAGLPSFAGKEDNEPIKKVDDREYPSGMTGKELFRNNGTNDDGTDDGGYLLSKAKGDPYGSTARAFRTFDKATIVLKTFAATNLGTDEINETVLPQTKADSMDLEDEIVGIQVRMKADLNQFADTLTRAVQKKISQIDLEYGQGKHLMSLARYDAKEKEVAKDFYKSKKSGLSKIYEGIEEEAKARMASEMLIMTADPNYIADPSESRAKLVKPSQRNKFRYAALIQQEKNKMLKLKYAHEIKRKQQMVDIIKKQALLRASVFRSPAAKHELEHLLKKADESIGIQ